MPELSAPSGVTGTRSGTRDRIQSVARELYRDLGVRSVTMSQIAEAAGLSRQMVYKVFFDRKELVREVAIERILEIADLASGEASGDFATAFVEVSVRTIELLRGDAELGDLFGEGSPVSAYETLWSPELVTRARQHWAPWLAIGRAERRVRPELTDDEITDWLQTVYASIVVRPHIDLDRERAMIERFVTTSLR
ncbi:TetR/AcrR family transcriptional regulator [Nocardioides sp. Root190]|uniref:TetR/AcrR family transcriptional regulator n=1 Tax=Nocardioides sp. Root190 TaxID=1736488 RepID=UPI0019108642|nr:TetR/AcrR family transcriptional regulator [Nocardioides sp. Root190]